MFAMKIAILLILALSTLACGEDTSAKKDAVKVTSLGTGEGGRARAGDLKRDGYAVEAVDLNQDEKPDQWVVKDSARTVRIERDMNFDGKVDVWSYPAKDSDQIVEEEMDLDLDGRVDLVVFYQNNLPTKKHLSLDFSGKFSITKFYDQQGSLLRVERDEDGNGVADIFEYYENNQRVRVGWDETGDGQPDRFDTL
jgi:hypothetical protein